MATGIQSSKIMNLREYQKKAVEWATKSDGLIIAPAGSGKTWIAASIIKHYHKLNPDWKFGWTAPTIETCQQGRVSLSVAGIPDGAVDIRCPHESVDFSKKNLLIVDECFPAWTKIGSKEISEIKIGDMVDSYSHNSKTVEKRRVLDVFKTPSPDIMVTVWTENGPTTCTPGHPFWNGSKYVPAASLTSADVVSTIPHYERGMQDVRINNGQKRTFFGNKKTHLRPMQRGFKIPEKEEGAYKLCVVQSSSHMYGNKACIQESGSNKKGEGLLFNCVPGFDGVQDEFRNNVYNKQEERGQNIKMDEGSYCFPRTEREGIEFIEAHRTQAENSRRKRKGCNHSSINAGVYLRASNGAFNSNKTKWDDGCSKLLQGRFGSNRSKAGGRGGRTFSQFSKQEGCGQKENIHTQSSRVVRVEVHERGSDSWNSAMRGQNHVYNFSVEGNENYFANGILVHNCKHSPAVSWKRIIESCNGLRYGFDATPWSDDDERNKVTKMLFRDRQYEISRKDIGDSLADAYLEISDATDLNIQTKIDENIDRLFQARRRYMRISDEDLKKMCAWESLVDIGICQNKERNRYAMQYALDHLDMQTLILIPRITLGEQYEASIPNARLVHSKIGKKDRRSYMEEFKAGNLRTMIATSLADEGLDLPNVELLIMVSGGRSSQKTIQRASRALRKTDTKNCATIVDFSDKFHPIGAFHARKRMTSYRELGCIFIPK